jgi:hypothetical protein
MFGEATIGTITLADAPIQIAAMEAQISDMIANAPRPG